VCEGGHVEGVWRRVCGGCRRVCGGYVEEGVWRRVCGGRCAGEGMQGGKPILD